MKRFLAILFASLMLVGLCPAATMAEAAGPKVLGYSLLSEIWIYEPRVTAIAIEFDKPLACAFDIGSYFQVNAELKELTSYEGVALPDTSWPMAPRKVVTAYTSSVPEKGVVNAGNYVIIELSDLDSNATSIYMSLKRNTLDPDKKLGYNGGREILPYGDNMIYEIKQLYDLKYADGTTTGTDFTYERRGSSIAIADEFVPGTYTSATTAITGITKDPITSIGYTLYSPPQVVEGEKYPLVVFLHGSSCRSVYEPGVDDRMTPVYTNQGPTTWIKNATPNTYVFVPQYEWATVQLVKEALQAVLSDDTLAVDRDRIYLSGLSMGGMSGWELLLDPQFKDLFAGALLCCDYPVTDIAHSSFDVLSDEMCAKIKALADSGLPIWLNHSNTDPTVPVAGSIMAYKAMLGIGMEEDMPAPKFANDEMTYYESENGKIRFTELNFLTDRRNVNLGMYSVSAHEVYEHTYSTPEYIQWLFAQTKTQN